MILPRYLYELINHYAEEQLHKVIPTISEDDCKFNYYLEEPNISIYKNLHAIILENYRTGDVESVNEFVSVIASKPLIYRFELSNTTNVNIIHNWSAPHLRMLTITRTTSRIINNISMPKLRLASIIGNNFVSIQNLNMPALKYLRICNNKIVLLPDFSNMQSLVEITANNNMIEYIDNIRLPLLEILTLENNSLTSIPDFSNLPSLLLIDVDNNSLTHMPDFSYCIKLHTIYCSYNRLTNIPLFRKLSKLVVLCANENSIEHIPYYDRLHVFRIDGNTHDFSKESLNNMAQMELYGVSIH